ncbi:MAG TPA: V-type ATP synthase subunit E family protein [Candidatus Nanoarchaeia archaeon]|nr:V-type ATP synthase subunit E family protein [Candidatus Nanoarchaeia archaeon]
MGLEIVKQEIMNEAKEQSASIVRDAKLEASSLIKEATRKVMDIKEKSDEAAHKMMEMIKKQELASAELEKKKLILEAKKAVIDEVFAQVTKALENLDLKKRESLLKKLQSKVEQELGGATIYCNKKDAKILKGAKPYESEILGGIIAENQSSTIRVDYSFETMLETIRESEMQNINRVLFE